MISCQESSSLTCHGMQEASRSRSQVAEAQHSWQCRICLENMAESVMCELLAYLSLHLGLSGCQSTLHAFVQLCSLPG